MGDDCLFCDIYERKLEPIVYENDHFFGLVDLFPVTPKHTLLIPKRHVISRFELTTNEAEVLEQAISRLIIEEYPNIDFIGTYSHFLRKGIYKKSHPYLEAALDSPFLELAPDGYNIGNNEGRAAGRTIDHLHFQIIPRYIGDIEDPTGGMRNIFPDKAKY